MKTGIWISSLVPSGLVVETVSDSCDWIILAARSNKGTAECPLCGVTSYRIHSRYTRQVADLPCAGKQIRLRVISRRFFCEVSSCRRRIFAERFGEDVLPTRSRRTARLEYIVHHLGLALGGRPAASFAKRLMLPVSNDTLLRVVRRRTNPRTDPLYVVGIDDWVFSGRINVTAQWCATWSDGGLWRCFRIARSPRCELGFPTVRKSEPYPATVAGVMAKPPRERCPKPSKSPIVGI